jgi:hypothetical protein
MRSTCQVSGANARWIGAAPDAASAAQRSSTIKTLFRKHLSFQMLTPLARGRAILRHHTRNHPPAPRCGRFASSAETPEVLLARSPDAARSEDGKNQKNFRRRSRRPVRSAAARRRGA